MSTTQARQLPAGAVVVVAGPDGSGKSSLAAALAGHAPEGGMLWLHHRPHVLRGRAPRDGGPVTDPYGRSPYPFLLGAAKVAYYFLDYVIGWYLRARPVLERGGCVVLERGWWDLAADPRRYRLQQTARWVRWLGRFVPAATTTVVLTAPVEVLAARTQDDLSPADLGAQVQAYRETFSAQPTAVFLDATQTPEQITVQALAAIGSNPAARQPNAG